jgi:serine/threonine-protein kinase
MPITLAITEGPHAGQKFEFDRHDTFLVGRSKECHFQLSYDDPYFSRRHFLIEINPPRIRVMDLDSRNGIRVNGVRVSVSDLKDGDEVRAGHTVFKVQMNWPRDSNEPSTLHEPKASATLDYEPAVPNIPGYRLEKELGRGYMGVVHRATREADGRLVAIKTIMPAPGVQAKAVARFLREAQILGELKHGNIVGLIETGQVGAMVYLAMEFLTGPDVHEVLASKGPMKPKTAVRLICQVLQGLQYAHDKGFVHRDIKPANIILNTEEGKRVAKLADFGLARAFESSKMSGLTMQGEVGGTPAFMAPEQVTHYRDVTPLADQYSVAATLYNLLTGAFPYELPKNLGQALVKILTTDPIPILEHLPDLDEGLSKVIDIAMSKDPARRYPNAAAFMEALMAYR